MGLTGEDAGPPVGMESDRQHAVHVALHSQVFEPIEVVRVTHRDAPSEGMVLDWTA